MTKPLVLKPKFLGEIFKTINFHRQDKGTVLVIAFLTMGVLLLLGIYFLSFTITESRIAKSQKVGTQAYYIAEAGINKAIWKLKHDKTTVDGDDPWATCFVTSTAPCSDCTDWSATFVTSTDLLIPNSTVQVTIQNSDCARGRITATSTITLSSGKTAQRVVKTAVFKSLAAPTDGAAIFSGGASENIEINFSKIKIYGDLFCNHNLNIKGGSTVEVYDQETTVEFEGRILAVGNYIKSTDSTVSSTAICASDICQTTSTCFCAEYPEKFQKCEENECPPEHLSMPLVDFDSATSTSFKSRAQSAEDAGQCQNLCNGSPCLCDGGPCLGNDKCVLDDDEFEDLLWAAGEGGTLTLNTATTPGIVYVTGLIELRGGRHLIVNGALVADGTMNIGERYKWTRGGQQDMGFSKITVNRPTAITTSGLLTKAKMNFGLYSSFAATTTITGVVYANDEVRFISLPKSFTLTGGIVARKLSFTSVWQWFNFILDNEIILYGLGYKIDGTSIKPEYSPIITVEHWEETY